MLAPGHMLDWFRIEALLGQGGMGAVYRAHDTRLDREVAVKVLSLDSAIEGSLATQARARLVREARAAAAISHPSAVAIHHVGESAGEPYIVMELIDGVTLREATKSDAPAGERIAWLVEVAEALVASHARGIVHRDVKPDNVMILRNGHAKVLDFGIARRATADDNAARESDIAALATLTAPGAVVGTPAYLAPEQIHGAPADERCDQFAWAVTAYETLARELPWGPITNATALIGAILTRPIPDLAERCRTASPAACAAIQRALSRDPSARFATMAELVQALRASASSPSLVITPPGGSSAQEFVNAATQAFSVEELTKGVPTALVTAPVLPAASRDSRPLGDVPVTGSLGPAITSPGLVAAPRRPRAGFGALAVGAVLATLGGLGFLVVSQTRGPAPTAPVASASGAPHVDSTVPAALAELNNGIDAFRHRSVGQSLLHFDHALELDPNCTAAHVWLAELHLSPTQTGSRLAESGRRHFAEAKRGIARLDDKQRATLLAFEPLSRATPDAEAFLAAATELAKNHPEDPDILYVLQTAQHRAHRGPESDATARKIIAIDPSFAQAYRDLCKSEADGKGGALACFDRCLAAAPSAGPCHDGRANELAAAGQCVKLAEEGRSWDAVDPEHWGGLLRLADALYAQGDAVEAVNDTLRRALAKHPSTTTTTDETPRALWLAASGMAATGDFDGALKELRRFAAANVGPSGRAAEALLVADVLDESGRPADARAELEAAIRESAAWTREERRALLPLELRAAHIDWLAKKTVPRAEYVRGRTARDKDAVTALTIIAATGLAVDDAKEVLAIAGVSPDALPAGVVGEAKLRTGDAAGAVPLLKHALAPCARLEGAIQTLRRYELYGEALEKTGDLEGAKQAFARVLAYWGKSTPRSVTAEAAKLHLQALGHGKASPRLDDPIRALIP